MPGGPVSFSPRVQNQATHNMNENAQWKFENTLSKADLVFLTYIMHQKEPGQIRIIVILHQLETSSEDFFIAFFFLC